MNPFQEDLDKLKRKHPNYREFTTGLRFITPGSTPIDSSDPRWEAAEFEETIFVVDPAFVPPKEWKLVKSPS